MIEYIIVIFLSMFIGYLWAGACQSKQDYIYQRKMRRAKIRDDFDDFMRDYRSGKFNKKTN